MTKAAAGAFSRVLCLSLLLGAATPAPAVAPDPYEDDDAAPRASVIILNDLAPQHHNVHDPADEDWIAFFAIEDTYRVAVFAMDNKGNISLPGDAAVHQAVGGSSKASIGVAMSNGGNSAVTLFLSPGPAAGVDADWWLEGVTPDAEFYYLNLAPLEWLHWLPGMSPTFQGPLFALPPITIPGLPGQPGTAGRYTFSFGADTTLNGVVDGELFFDSITVPLAAP